MKFRDKITKAYEEMLEEQYTVAGSSTGRSGSKGQRASNVALVCPQCGDLDDHSHEGLEKGAKCPKCGQIVEERVDEKQMGVARGPKGKAKTWEEARDKPMRVFLQTTVVLKARDFADAEWQVLNAFEKKKPKVKGMTIEKFSVDAIDEL
jgi:predicted RNA-binding Zn-ribbon protein involved in translation (DUF1610 family)